MFKFFQSFFVLFNSLLLWLLPVAFCNHEMGFFLFCLQAHNIIVDAIYGLMIKIGF
jgi:hypothetical protein